MAISKPVQLCAATLLLPLVAYNGLSIFMEDKNAIAQFAAGSLAALPLISEHLNKVSVRKSGDDLSMYDSAVELSSEKNWFLVFLIGIATAGFANLAAAMTSFVTSFIIATTIPEQQYTMSEMVVFSMGASLLPSFYVYYRAGKEMRYRAKSHGMLLLIPSALVFSLVGSLFTKFVSILNPSILDNNKYNMIPTSNEDYLIPVFGAFLVCYLFMFIGYMVARWSKTEERMVRIMKLLPKDSKESLTSLVFDELFHKNRNKVY